MFSRQFPHYRLVRLYRLLGVDMARDSSVSIGTRYGLDGQGIESRWGARFSAPVQTGPGTHPTSYTVRTGALQGVQRPGRGIDHPTPFSAEVKERVELYLYSGANLGLGRLGSCLGR